MPVAQITPGPWSHAGPLERWRYWEKLTAIPPVDIGLILSPTQHR